MSFTEDESRNAHEGSFELEVTGGQRQFPGGQRRRKQQPYLVTVKVQRIDAHDETGTTSGLVVIVAFRVVYFSIAL